MSTSEGQDEATRMSFDQSWKSKCLKLIGFLFKKKMENMLRRKNTGVLVQVQPTTVAQK